MSKSIKKSKIIHYGSPTCMMNKRPIRSKFDLRDTLPSKVNVFSARCKFACLYHFTVAPYNSEIFFQNFFPILHVIHMYLYFSLRHRRHGTNASLRHGIFAMHNSDHSCVPEN